MHFLGYDHRRGGLIWTRFLLVMEVWRPWKGHHPPYSSSPPKCGWLVACFCYMKTPPTHYYLESTTVDEHPLWRLIQRVALHTHTKNHVHGGLVFVCANEPLLFRVLSRCMEVWRPCKGHHPPYFNRPPKCGRLVACFCLST
jgi:hypothetical protein